MQKIISLFQRNYDGDRTQHNHMEGIVWHHEDGRMVKIKGRDFGIKRGSVL